MTKQPDLEWAAQWIEGSLKGETNERLVEFGRNIAMTLRAELNSRADFTIASALSAARADTWKAAKDCVHETATMRKALGVQDSSWLAFYRALEAASKTDGEEEK